MTATQDDVTSREAAADLAIAEMKACFERDHDRINAEYNLAAASAEGGSPSNLIRAN